MIDLHVHTTMSDGTYTPAGIARLAKERGVEAFSITDHDMIDGNAEAAEEAKKLGVEFVNGMELTLGYKGRRLHVVCLGFDMESVAFKELYTKLRGLKEGKLDNVIEHIHNKGVDIDRKTVEKYVSSRLDRYTIMRCLVDVMQTSNIQHLWDNYVDPAIREVGNSEEISLEEGLALMKKAGGVTSLAHYHKKIGLKTFEQGEREDIMKYFISCGLDGMERYYPNYTQEDSDFAGYLIEKYNLMATGGSDFHGDNRRTVEFGTGTDNNLNVPYAFWQDIMKRLGR